LAKARRRGGLQRLSRRCDQCAGLGLAFALFVFGDAVGNDPGAGLDVHDAVEGHRAHAGNALQAGGQFGVDHRPAFSAIITFTIFESAYYSEIMRAGIQSVSRGQVQAGYAVGMTYGQCMRLVVLPQAFRNMLPVLLTQTIVLFQDTSLVYAIGATDLLKGFQVAGGIYNRTNEMVLLAAVVYFILSFSLSMLVRRLQKKIQIIR